MKFLAILALLPLAFAQDTPQTKTGDLGDAAVITGNPNNVTYAATFDQSGKINGEFLFHAGPGGKGVHVAIELKGFPAGKGPFSYHIHDQPVPADGNCTGTKAHLDPYVRGQLIPCDPTRPESCEVGDLAGKHGGKIGANATEFKKDYSDDFLSLISPSGQFIGNRSIVIHANDSSRIVCANITAKEHGHGGPVPTTPTETPDSDSGAERLATGAFAAIVVAFAAALL